MKNMQVVTIPQVGRDRRFAYEYEVSLTNVGNSEWILIPEDVNGVAVALSISSGSAKVQYTLSDVQTVIGGVPVVLDWPLGTVFADSQDACRPVTALRLVQESAGQTKLQLRAQ